MDVKSILSIQMMRNGYSRDVLRGMCQELRIDKTKTVLEIGSYAGEATEIFSRFAKRVFAIDAWETGMELTVGSQVPEGFTMSQGVEFIFNLRVESLPNIVKIKALDSDVVDYFADGSIDFIYIDALHTEEEVSRQIKSWLPKISFSGAIGGHDYCNYYSGVIRAVNKIIGDPDKIYDDVGNSWIKYKHRIGG